MYYPCATNNITEKAIKNIEQTIKKGPSFIITLLIKITCIYN